MTDEQLVTQYLQGDEKSLEILIQRYLPQVYGFSRHYSGNPDTASDIAEEALIKAWRSLKKFDRSKSFKSWIFTITKNTALDWLKRRDATPFSAFGDENALYDTIPDTAPSPHDDAIAHEAASHSKLLLLKISDKYREVISLRHFDDLTFSQIAMLLEEPLNTIKSRYRRGLKLLQQAIGSILF